jgi:hypothetical protein
MVRKQGSPRACALALASDPRQLSDQVQQGVPREGRQRAGYGVFLMDETNRQTHFSAWATSAEN